MTKQATTLLRINASMRKHGSTSRQLTDELIDSLVASQPNKQIVTRELAGGVPFVDEDWIGANFTDESERSEAQKAKLAMSDEMVAELEAADTIVIGVPIYNFGVPAALKAWVDMVCRARRTFAYTENGPVGLLKDKKAYLVIASGGTDSGSEIDFATGYLRHVLGFIGIHDVTVVDASGLMKDENASLARARGQISEQLEAA
ncbi:MAG: NAD(P)H-dependent oxidoreductase [Rhizobiaceae bacterium]|nr:NAD(P)H-dependent oxidoreductase [Hyphomicrobiales bacterium]NRB30299.1 NAD(P)H-dependent oxidoreductase [Rhizobiaceae bacterium]